MLEAGLLLFLLLLLVGGGLLMWRLVAGRPSTRRGWLGRLVVLGVINVVLVAALGYTTMNARTFQLFGTIVPSVTTTQPLVALTFDDGPSPETAEILAVLVEKNIKATFFLVGQHIEQQPAAAAAILAGGHEVANHSYSHPRMLLKSWDFIRHEIEQTDQLIRDLGYTGTIHFRSPYGKKLVLLPLYLSQQDKINILFDVEPESYGDVVNNAERIVTHVVERTKPGSIILLHPENAGWLPSRQALPQVIDALHTQGYQFVTVSELLAAAD